MNTDEHFIELWNDYLEGELDVAGTAEIRELLKINNRFAELAADSYQMHRLLGLLAQDAESQQNDFIRETMARLPADENEFVSGVTQRLRPAGRTTGRKKLAWRSMATAAAAIAVVATVFVLRSSTEPVMVRITELHGPIHWTGDGGRILTDLAIGDSLHGGTLESFSANSWIEFEFVDGSTVTVSGPSMLTISQQRQKVLHLRHGNLSASIAPQPIDQPLRVHTPAADLEVLGTQFNLDTDPSVTLLTVNEGRVRMKRVTDGSVVEVPAEHHVLASIDERLGLRVMARDGASHSWRSDLARDATYGKWISDLISLGFQLKKAIVSGEMTREEADAAYKAAATLSDNKGSLRAVPWLLKYSQSADKPTVTYLAALSVSRGQTDPVVVAKGGEFRIQGRVRSPTDIVFGITTNTLGGGFAGKFIKKTSSGMFRREGNAFDIEVPLTDFQAQEARFGESPIGKELVDWWCFTVDQDAKLEITNVELLAP